MRLLYSTPGVIRCLENVGALITRLGFDAVDAGPLRNARYLKPLSLLNTVVSPFVGFA